MLATANILADVGRETSIIQKQAILSKYKTNSTLKSILHFIYNPYFRTNISEAKFNKAEVFPGYPIPKSVDSLMKYLVEHHTGDMETCGIAKTWVYSFDTYAEKWLAHAIVTQNLQIGINVLTLNKVFGPDFISKISCMLGTPLDKIPMSRQKWPYIVTEKLDGVRRILLKQNGVVRLFSRSGHEDFGLVDIIEEAKYLPDNYAYDGELLAIGSFKDSIAQRQATNSIANKKGERHGLTFNVFDMVPIAEFLVGSSSQGSLARKRLLAATLNDSSGAKVMPADVPYETYAVMYNDGYQHQVIKPVPILQVAHCMEDIEPVVNSLWAAGKEGVMLNALDAKYEAKRTKTLVKMKKTETYVLRIEGFSEGINKYTDMLGALVTEYCGCMLQVGSGFTDYEREDIWQNQDKYIGALFEVEAFGVSTNKNGLVSLNCPIFKRIVAFDDAVVPAE